MGRRRFAVLALVGVLGTVLAGGCDVADAMCSEGEYPVASIRSSAGGACVKNGEAPPSGYVRYPVGKVPKHVDDKWDQYWQNHVLDENGHEVAGT